jgi:hypothetical protein
VLAAVVSLAVLVSLAAADDGSVGTVGGAVRLMKDQGNIRMVSETVRARISLAVDRMFADTTVVVEVDCVFLMKNEGPADTVLVGFPDGAMGPYESGGEEHELDSFRSWVDGVEVECRRVPNVKGAPPFEVGSWWIKRVPFARGAVRTIRDRYTVLPSWYASLGTQAFRYTLSMGASWKGTIGSAEVVATLEGIPLEWITGSDPEARRAGRSFRWSFRDFEPGSDDGSPASVALEWKSPHAEEPDTLGK